MAASTRPTIPGPGRDALACLLCAGVGLALAVAPHLTMLATHGSADYVADGDDVLYLAIARIPYYGEFALRDPFADRSRNLPTLYSWAQFVPLAALTRVLGLPPTLIGLVWRAVGGPLLGGALYLLFRRFFAGSRHPVAWAIGCAVTCLADGGFLLGRSLVESFGFFASMYSGSIPGGNLNGLPQYRVVTPLLNLPFLLLMVASLVPGARRSAATILLGGAALGMCFLLYFFFWTAAVVGLSGSITGLLVRGGLDRARRSADWSAARAGAAVLGIGVVLGAGQVYDNARTYGSPEVKPVLGRLSRGVRLPEGAPARWRYAGNRWTLAKIVVGGALIAGLGLEGLGLIWWLTLAGYLLQNSALLTHLEFENYHWIMVQGPLGEILLLGIAGRLVERYAAPGRSWPAWLGVIPVVLLAIAAAWRPYHALHAPATAAYRRVFAELAPLRPALERLRPGQILAGPPAANLALLWTRCGQLYQDPQTGHSSMIADREVHERHALNAWLQGLDPAGYDRAIADAGPFAVGEGDRPEWRPEAVQRARAACFREILVDPAPFLKRYHPDVLLLPAAAPAPTRGGPWSPSGTAPAWSLWVKADAATADAGPRPPGRSAAAGSPGFDRTKGTP